MNTAAAIIGPNKQYYVAGVVVRGAKRARAVAAKAANRPVNYAHLVEFGHVAVKPKKGTSRKKKNATVTGNVAPKPFMRPGLIQATPMAEAILGREVENALYRRADALRAVGAER